MTRRTEIRLGGWMGPYRGVVPSSGPTYSLDASQGTHSLNGQTVGLLYNREADGTSGTYSLNGQAAVLTYNAGPPPLTELVCDQGSYSQNGQAVGLLYNREVGGTSGTYNLNGQSASLEYAQQYTLDANASSYVFFAWDADLAWNQPNVYTLDAQSGAYPSAEYEAEFSRGYNPPFDQGSYSLSGVDVGLSYVPAGQYEIAAENGSCAVSGQNTLELEYNRIFLLEAGFYSQNGQTAGVIHNRSLQISQDGYSLLGNPAGLEYNRQFVIDSGNYLLNGQDVTLVLVAADYVAGFVSIQNVTLTVPYATGAITPLGIEETNLSIPYATGSIEAGVLSSLE